MSRKLEVVTDATPNPAKAAPTTIKAAIDVSERALLVAMRQNIAADLDSGVPPHTKAPLMRQLREMDKEIRSLDLRAAQEGAADSHVEDGEFDASAV